MEKNRARRNRITKVLSLIAVIAVLFTMSSCDILRDTLNPDFISEANGEVIGRDDKTVTVKFLDIGQGDSALIITPNKTMLIDGGINGSGTDVINKVLKDYNITKLDYMIATHAHADHIGGFDEVIKYVDSVECVYMPEIPEDMVPATSSYRKFLNAVLSTDADVISPKYGDTLTMDNAVFTFIGPADGYEDLNESSIVVRMDVGETSFLFTGDCTIKAFYRIIDSGADVDVDVLKVAHHGSSNATNKKLLNAITPDYAVISCGIDNSYGHPHKEVVDFLNKAGVEYYRTDWNGTVTMTTDGENININVEKGEKNGK